MSITVKTNNTELDSSFFEFVVIPLKNVSRPIHFVKGNTETMTYTGKDDNKIYLIYEREQNEAVNNFVVSAYTPKEENVKLTFKALTLNNDIYFRVSVLDAWEDYFSQTNFVSNPGEPYLLIPPINITQNVAIFIIVESDKPNIQINVLMGFQKLFSPIILIPYYNSIYYFGKGDTVPIIYPEKIIDEGKGDSYDYLIELNKIIGDGNVQLGENKSLYGKKTLRFSKEQINEISKFLVTNEKGSFILSIRIWKEKKEKKLTESFSINNQTNFIYNSNPFPLYYYGLISKNASSVSINLKYMLGENNHQENIYNYSNIIIESSLINQNQHNSILTSNDIDSYNIPVMRIEDKQTAYITIDLDNDLHDKYDCVYIKITEKEKSEGTKYKTHQFQITSFYEEKDILKPLIQNKYFFNKINLSSQNSINYILGPIPAKYSINLEFSSCSKDDKYSLTFAYKNGETVTEDKIHITEEYGKTIYQISPCKDSTEYIKLAINVANKDTKQIAYHLIKYTVIELNNKMYIDTYESYHLITEYEPFNYTITSKWGYIQDSSTFKDIKSSFFFYYLYEKRGSYSTINSICSLFSPAYFIPTINRNITITNSSFYGGGYDSVVVGYFVSENEVEHLILFEPKPVYISSSNIGLWIGIIFGVVVLLIGFAAIRLYLEIKKRENDTEKEQNPKTDPEKKEMNELQSKENYNNKKNS